MGDFLIVEYEKLKAKPAKKHGLFQHDDDRRYVLDALQGIVHRAHVFRLGGSTSDNPRWAEDHVLHLCTGLAEILVGLTSFEQRT